MVATIAGTGLATDFGDYSGFPSGGTASSPLIRMGNAATDDEIASQTNGTALADDANSTDDEDGVVWSALIKGEVATVTVQVTNQSAAAAYLSGWIDFNHNGVPTDSGEQIVVNEVIPSGSIGVNRQFTFAVPAAAFKGSVGARFRMSSTNGAGPTGTLGSGEVEDYLVPIQCPTIIISPNTLPAGYIGTAYYQTITTVQGTPSYTWSIVNGTLPTGLSFVTPSQPYVGPGTAYSNLFLPTGSVTVDPPNGGLLSISLGGSAGPSDVGIWRLHANGGASIGVLGLGILETGAQTQITDTALKFNMSNNSNSLLGLLGIGTSITSSWQADATFDKPGAVLTLKPSSTYHLSFHVDGHNGLLQSGLGIVPTFSVEFLDGAGNAISSASSGTLINLLGLLGTGVTSGTVNLSFRTPATLPAGSPTVRFKGGAILNTTVLGLGKTFATISGVAITETDSTDSSTVVIVGTPTQTETQIVTIRVVDYYGCEGQTTITIPVHPQLDFGDLPSPYATLLAENGPRHTLLSGFSLGNAMDPEPDGQASVAADGDGADDDGISFSELVAGERASISYTVTNTPGVAGKINAWIDWNHDGDFDDPNEEIASNLPADSVGTFFIIVPPDAVTNVPLGARFRLSTATGVLPTGTAADGEVEDYLVTVISALSIGDLVWNDTNFNGWHDPGEWGIQGITVGLYATTDSQAGNGDDVLLATTSTNALGGYLFDRIPTGKYVVRVLPSAAFPLASGNAVTTDDQTDHDNNGTQIGGQGTPIFSPVIVLFPGSESIADGDANENTELTIDFALRTCPEILITPPELPPGNVNSVYSEGVTASGGSGAYFFTMIGGALPAGLALQSTGMVMGTPSVAGTFSFTVQAVDSLGCIGRLDVSVTVRPLPIIHALAKDDQGRYLIGGEFYEVNGVQRRNLVRLNRDGSVDLQFAPDPPNGAVFTIAHRNGDIYVGGAFTQWGAEEHHLLVKLNADGLCDTAFAGNVFSANPGDAVYSISQNGFYVCGKFSLPSHGIAAINPSTGTRVTEFNPIGPGPGSVLYDVNYDGTRVVTVGDFTIFNGVSRNGIAAMSTDGNLDPGWLAGVGADGPMRSLIQFEEDSDFISVGDFANYGSSIGLNGVARIDRDSGVARLGFAGVADLSVHKVNKVAGL